MPRMASDIHQQAIANLLKEHAEKRSALSRIRTPEEEEQPTADGASSSERNRELLWVAGRT